MYLWHYPVFSFGYILEFSYENVSRRLILLTIFLSIISYYFIEKPFRNKKIISNKTLFTIVLSLILLIISFSFLAINKDGFKNRFSRIIDLDLRNKKKIEFNQNGTKGDIVLIGDSHAEALEFILNNELTKNEYNLFRF